MAEEVLKYKVEIDSSDVAEQLQQIRNNVDLAMSSVAEQQVKPTTFQRVSQVFETANIGGIADSFRAKFEADTQNTLTGMTSMLDRTATQMQLGYSRATSDLRRAGILAPAGDYPTLAPALAQPAGYPTMGTGEALAASTLGTGFDPTGTVTRAQYTASAAAQLTNNFDRFIQSTGVEAGVTALGTGIGAMAGGLPGAVAGGLLGNLVGGAAQGVSNILTADAAAVTGVAQGLAEIAPGGASFRAGEGFYRSMAQGMQDYTRSFEGRLLGVTGAEQQMQIGAFAEAGGFKGMSPSEMSMTVQQLTPAVRNVSQNLHMAQSDATNLIADMQRIGMGGETVLQTSQAAVALGVQGGLIGASPASMLGTASQGIAAVAGTTMGTGDAAQLAMQTRIMTSAASMGGAPGVSPFIQQMGGAENASFAIMEQGLRQMMSPIGLARTANMMGGGSEMASINEAMSGAASYFSSDPTNIFSAMANQGAAVGSMSPLTIANAPVADAVGFLRGSGMVGEGPIGADVIAGAMMSFDPSMSASQAFAQIGIAGQGPNDLIASHIQTSRELVAGNRSNEVGALKEFVTGVTQPFVDLYSATIGEAGKFVQSGFEGLTRGVGDTVTEWLTGTVTERGSAIYNQERITTTGQIIEGTHTRVNKMRHNLGTLKMDEEDFQNIVIEEFDQLRNEEADRFLDRGVAGTDFLRSGKNSKEMYSIFKTVGFGTDAETKKGLANYLKKKQASGGDMGDVSANVEDIVHFDALMLNYQTESVGDHGSGEEFNKEYNAVVSAVSSKIQGGDITSWLQSEDVKTMSDMDQVDALWEKTGYGGSIWDASAVERNAFLEMFVGSKSQITGETRDSYIGQFGFTGSGVPGGDSFRTTVTDSILRNDIRTAIGKHANLDEIKGKITIDAEENLSETDMEAIRKAFGNDDLTSADIHGLILGTDRNSADFNAGLKALLNAPGGRDTRAKLLSMRNTIGDETITVGGETMSFTEALNIEDALSVKSEILENANSMKQFLPESLFDNDTANKIVMGLALREHTQGKDKKFNLSGYQQNRLLQMDQLKQSGGLSEQLELSMSVDILEGSEKLAAAVDFTSKFEGFDKAILDAATEQLQIAHYSSAIDANKKLIDSFESSEAGGTKLKVKMVYN